MQTLLVFLPYIEGLASTAGAGAAASDCFDVLRRWWLSAPVSLTLPGDRAVNWLLTSRIGARISVIVLSAAISIICSGIIAHATGQPVGPALDKALAAIVASQIYHLKTMRGQVAADTAPYTFEAE